MMPTLNNPEQPHRPVPAVNRDTVDLLRTIYGDAFADRFVDFLRLTAGDLPLRVTVPLAGHALRELESMLRGILKFPFKSASDETDVARLTDAARVLKEVGFDDQKVKIAVRMLTPKPTHEQEIRSIVAWLGMSDDGEVAKAWLGFVGEQQGYAHKRSFHQNLAVDDTYRSTFIAPLELVARETALALQRKYGKLFDRVDELTGRADYKKAVADFKAEIPGAGPLQRRFFAKIEGDGWLLQLEKQGLLREPIANADDEEAGIVRWREWAPGDYLLRVSASQNVATRTLVASALRSNQSSADPALRDKGFEILLALPISEASELLDVAKAWLAAPVFWTLRKQEEYLRQLALAGYFHAAVEFATALFKVTERNGSAVGLYEKGLYEEAVERILVPVVASLEIDGIHLLARLLMQALQAEGQVRADGVDLSYITSEHLNDAELRNMGVHYALAAALRDSMLAMVRKDEAHSVPVINLLSQRKERIFQSLRLIVLAETPTADPQATRDALLDPQLLTGHWARAEYGALAKVGFTHLAGRDQTALLATIEKLPAQREQIWRERFAEQQGRAPNEGEVKDFGDFVLRDLVWTWREVLPTEWQERVQAIEAKHGVPFEERWNHPGFWKTEENPLPDDAGSRPVEEIVSIVSSWKPGDAGNKYSAGSLIFRVRHLAEADPAQYADELGLFVRAPHGIRKAVLEGLSAAIKNGRALNWHPVLAACSTWLDEPVVDPDFSVAADRFETLDGNYYIAIAELLTAGFYRGTGRLPPDLDDVVLKIQGKLLEISSNPAAQVVSEPVLDGDAFFNARATVAGASLEAVILRVWWRLDIGLKQKGEGLDYFEASKISKMLDQNDALTGASHAIVGRYFTLLSQLDEKWMRTELPRVFPMQDTAPHLRKSAFEGHLLHDVPSFANWKEVEGDYRREFQVSPGSLTSDRRSECLASHIVSLFLDGQIDLSAGSLMSEFLAAADVKLRQRAMWMFASNLPVLPEKMAPEVRQRLQAYIEGRLAALKDSEDKTVAREELSMIGLYFEKAHDQQWMLDVACRMAAMHSAPAHSTTMMAWLASKASDHVAQVIGCLKDLVQDSGIARWMFGANRDHVRQIIEVAKRSQIDGVAKAADEIVNILLSHGEVSFIDLKS